MARKKRAAGEPIVIKKYANRRLYNTETSSYVTLDELAKLIKTGEDLTVEDAKTGEDLTRTVLTQIILERENKSDTMLPLSFLRQLICFYGDNMQSMVPAYLDSTMEILSRHQTQLKQAFGDVKPEGFMPLFEELARQNMAFLEETMQMAVAANKEDSGQKNQKTQNENQDLNSLKKQLDDLQKKVEAFSK